MPDTASGFGLLQPANSVCLRISGHEVALSAGDLALIDRQALFLVTGDDHWTADLLELGSRGFRDLDKRRLRSIGEVLNASDPLALIVKRLWTVGQDINRLALADDITNARLIDLIADLTRKLLTSRNNGSDSKTGDAITSHRIAMIERAELQIAAHYVDSVFSPGALATDMRITPRHLSSLFASAGTTATKVILAYRLSRAKMLLRDPANRHLQISEISRSSGFDDQNYFARCFRRQEGVAPGQYRDSCPLST